MQAGGLFSGVSVDKDQLTLQKRELIKQAEKAESKIDDLRTKLETKTKEVKGLKQDVVD